MARTTLSTVTRALIVALYLTVTLKQQAGTPSEQMSTGNTHNTRSAGSRSLSAAAPVTGTLGSAAQEPEEAVEESRPDDGTAYTLAEHGSAERLTAPVFGPSSASSSSLHHFPLP